MLFQSIPYIIKLILAINLLVTGVIWLDVPVVIEADIPNLEVAGISSGFVIFINRAYVNEDNYEEVLKHEYVHFSQQAIFTPLGMWLYNGLNFSFNFIKYGSDKPYFYLFYKNNLFERQAFELQDSPFFYLPKRTLTISF